MPRYTWEGRWLDFDTAVEGGAARARKAWKPCGGVLPDGPEDEGALLRLLMRDWFGPVARPHHPFDVVVRRADGSALEFPEGVAASPMLLATFDPRCVPFAARRVDELARGPC